MNKDHRDISRSLAEPRRLGSGLEFLWGLALWQQVVAGLIVAAIVAIVSLLLKQHVQTNATIQANGAQCIFGDNGGNGTCKSTDSQIVLNSLAEGDTSACIGNFELAWGDGEQQSVVHQGGTPGPHFLVSHTYQKPGTYIITETATPISGGCAYSPGTFYFTLL